jgi:hypothetical protein
VSWSENSSWIAHHAAALDRVAAAAVLGVAAAEDMVRAREGRVGVAELPRMRATRLSGESRCARGAPGLAASSTSITAGSGS